MGENPKKYHVTDDGDAYRVNEDGSFTSMGNVESMLSLKVSDPNSPVLQRRKIMFPIDIHFQANLIGIFNSKGGKLHIYPETIGFKPHFLNFGSHQEQLWSISNIIGYTRGSATLLTLHTADEAIQLAVWKKDSIINEIENRRRAYFTNRGLSIPQLVFI